MNDAKLQAIEKIETKKQLISDVADKIWEYAELSLQEYKSCDLYCEVLEKKALQ